MTTTSEEPWLNEVWWWHDIIGYHKYHPKPCDQAGCKPTKIPLEASTQSSPDGDS